MMSPKKWEKRDGSMSIEEVVARNTGMSIEAFLNPQKYMVIAGLQDAASAIQEALKNGTRITIYGDYDVDGITSTTILYIMLSAMGCAKVDVILPRRFTEGYGLSMKGVDRISDGLLLTVDNGISAVDQIAAARAKGLKVVVLDHHLGRDDGRIPDADVIVDPHVIKGSDFEHYCGAGIAFKLACILIKNNTLLLKKLCALAAIGTVADVMPLVSDNRAIVTKGLEYMNQGIVVPGLAALLTKLDLAHVSEGDIGFKIGPVLNAAGRMYDDGAARAFRVLADPSAENALKGAEELIQTNEARKEAVAEGYALCEQIIEEHALFADAPLLIYTPADAPIHLSEGIVGILAGRLAEKYKVPSIVMTETHDGTKFKGSARSYGDIHLKALLDTAADCLAGYGGHAGAAGLSCEKERVEELRSVLIDNLAKMGPISTEDPNTVYYDLEVNAHQLPAVLEKLKLFAPYGEGNPAPVFKVNGIRLTPRAGKFYRLMGNKGQHIKLFGTNYDVVGFDLAPQYQAEEEPMYFDAVGMISENRFQSTVTPQLEMMDFHTRPAAKNVSPLASALAERMKSRGFIK